MNRRDFFKTTGIGIASVTFIHNPQVVLANNPSTPTYRSKDYWKQYFIDNTQEYNVVYELMRKRYTEDTFVQMHNFHTDTQIDKLPNKNGPYKIFRILYKYNKSDTIPVMFVELVATPIILES